MEKESDNLLDFFNLKKDLNKETIQGLQTGGPIKTTGKEEPTLETNESKANNEPTNYYTRYREAERQRMVESSLYGYGDTTGSVLGRQRSFHSASGLESDDAVPSNDMQDDHVDLTKQFNFNNISHDSHQLPICAEKEKILDFVASYPVVVISGFTGCGKTTQVPQYILDKHAVDRKRVNIIVTQPRKLAARSVAERVCQERGWEMGKLVGYQVGLDKANKTQDTRLLYVTTGVLKRMLINKKAMNDWTHIILDEVHEREQDMDFVMLICKKLIHSNSRGVKIILMSATMNERKFCEYFSYVLPGNLPQAAPSIILPNTKKTNNKVQEYSLDDFQKYFPQKEEMPRFGIGQAKLETFCIKVCRTLIEKLDVLEQQMRENDLGEDRPAPDTGAVLVFLPGLAEIQTVQDWLKEHDVNRKGTEDEPKWWILPLHSSIPVEEHKLIFKKAPNFQRKIILSTNIAESSVTVPDIVYIVDFCLTKNIRADADTNYPRLVMEWASKQQCTQRKGRAGRVREGRVFRMIDKDFYENLNEEHEPELKRAPLSKVVLDTKLLEFGSPKELLALTMDPPDLHKLQKTIVALKEIGALLTTVNGQQSYDDGDLTVLGEIIANLPVDVRIGKLIVYGHVFNILEDAIIIAAGLNGKSMFTAPFEKRIQAYKNKLWWADNTFSDCFAILLAFKTWMQKQRRGEFRMGSRAEGRRREQQFCDSSFLQMKVLHEMKLQVEEIEKNLEHLEIKPSQQQQGDGKGLGEEQKFLILRLIMFGAFYPNFFQRQEQSELEKQADRILSGRDPRNCVYLTGFPKDQVNYGVLYENRFKKMFASAGYYRNETVADNVDIEVEGHNVIVEFRKPVNENAMTFSTGSASGEIIAPVFVATKMRNSGARNRNLTVELYTPEEASKKMDEWKKAVRESCDAGLSPECVGQVQPPPINTSTIKFSVQHIKDPNSFWIHLKHHQEKEEQIHAIIRDNLTQLYPPESGTCGELVKSGAIVLAPFRDNNEAEELYYRARINALDRGGGATVFFIDYGNVEKVSVSSLRIIDKNFIKRSPGILAIPGLALECSLSHIRPNKLLNTQGLWSPKAIEEFKALLLGSSPDKSGTIFSVTKASSSGHSNFLVSLEFVEVDAGGKKYELKKYLLGRNLAEKAIESYQSEEDAKQRVNCNTYSEAMQDHLNDYRGRYKVNKPKKEIPEDSSAPTVTCELRGPFSPLEYSVNCAYRQGSKKLVTVDMDSVNSVLLDPNPSDRHDQWLVAAHVGVSPSGENLLLRNTTWLPARPGLGPLAAMIFAPQVELRTDRERSQITGFLAGLGPKATPRHNRLINQTGGHEETQSYFLEHDMEIKFDVQVDNDDVSTVNKIRYWMNQVLSRHEDGLLGLTKPNILRKARESIRVHLTGLFDKDRQFKEKQHPASGREYRWNLLHKRHRMPSQLAEQDKYFLKMIDGVMLRVRNEQAVVFALNELLQAEGDSEERFGVALLCPCCPTLKMWSPREVYVHNRSEEHMRASKQFRPV